VLPPAAAYFTLLEVSMRSFAEDSVEEDLERSEWHLGFRGGGGDQ
jgi:hypothetical protein